MNLVNPFGFKDGKLSDLSLLLLRLCFGGLMCINHGTQPLFESRRLKSPLQVNKNF